MPSPLDLAKRELVKVLRDLATKYRVTLNLTRDSSNSAVRAGHGRTTGRWTNWREGQEGQRSTGGRQGQRLNLRD